MSTVPPRSTAAVPGQSTPLDVRERAYLHSRCGEASPLLNLAITIALPILAVVGIVQSPELHSFWPLFGLGIAVVLGAAFSLSVYFDETDLRADLAGGAKLWREGAIASMWMREDAEGGRPLHRLNIAVDGEDPECPLGFSVPGWCYDALAPGDRVRIAYAPRSRCLLDLIGEGCVYAAVDAPRPDQA